MWVVIQPPTDPHSTCCCIRPVTCPALWRRLCYSPVGPKYAVQLLMGSQGTVYGDANHGHHISVRINCIMKRHDIYVIGFCIVLTKTFCSSLANQPPTNHHHHRQRKLPLPLLPLPFNPSDFWFPFQTGLKGRKSRPPVSGSFAFCLCPFSPLTHFKC